VRAAELVRELAGRSDGLEIRLEKHIPVGAGLGGASSDAAAVIKGLDRLWSLGLGRDQMLRLAAQLGSDVPFFIQGGTALCTGRGEIVQPLRQTGELTFAMNLPQLVVSTRDIYRTLKSFLTKNVRNVRVFIETLEAGDPRLWGPEMFNRLEGPAFSLHPELAASRERLAGLRFAGVRMSGSGAALFGVAASGREAEALAREARASLSGRTVVVRTCAP
jgi:4-diphosphocytidyl-2-C-methyl-D-erythritol kinase